MSEHKRGIFWFTNDLRLKDNPALLTAAAQVDQLLCVHIIDTGLSQANLYGLSGVGTAKRQFLNDSLSDLNVSLESLGQHLHCVEGSSFQELDALIRDHQITHVFASRTSGFNENRVWNELLDQHSELSFQQIETCVLFDEVQLPFELTSLPQTFTRFRKQLADIENPLPVNAPSKLPSPIISGELHAFNHDVLETSFNGGETSANQHLDDYFSGALPAHYKEVRNALDGWNNSTKFSPCLAHGCVSARQITHRLRKYERENIANDSTYWIFFELLWREYFHWNARRFGAKLFGFSGTKNKTPLTSFYAERFKKWCEGNTPFPLVNACMNELSKTGYLSNRGRQIVASCLVNELQLDWRYGAAYFEKMLIDYDVASNWGNWQYLAGVGADAQDKRHFNLEKQTKIFDPSGIYINKWASYPASSDLDSVDAADWPI